MENYIVRQPILNREKEVVAYEIMVYNQDVEEPIEHKEKDIYAANTVKDFFMELDQTHFLGNKDAYLTFTPSLLIKEIPCIFSKDKLIIQVEDSAIVNPLSQKTLYHYKELGYRMALVDFEFSPRFLGIIDIIDIIKLDFSNPDQSSLSNVVSIARKFNKKIVAYNVNTRHAYDKARELAVDYIQGESVADVLRSTVHRMDHLKSNFFQLVVAVNREEPDVAEISSIISKDVTLSFRLMKLVNSAYFSLKNKVNSLSQAITVLGLAQLKQWIYLLSFGEEDDGISEELIRISFLRGNLCQVLAKSCKNFPITHSEAYLLGMFSTLGALMQVPLEDALKELPISDEIRRGLIQQEGAPGQLLRLILAYEKADWAEVKKEAEALGLDVNEISEQYVKCSEQVDQIWEELSQAQS